MHADKRILSVLCLQLYMLCLSLCIFLIWIEAIVELLTGIAVANNLAALCRSHRFRRLQPLRAKVQESSGVTEFLFDQAVPGRGSPSPQLVLPFCAVEPNMLFVATLPHSEEVCCEHVNKSPWSATKTVCSPRYHSSAIFLRFPPVQLST